MRSPTLTPLVFVLFLTAAHTGAHAAPLPAWTSAPAFSKLSLTAPLKQLFKAKLALAESDVPLDQQKNPSVEGSLSYADPAAPGGKRVIPVTVKVRGHTAWMADQCPFPKLSLKFKPEAVVHTPLEGHTKLKIGTHCGDRTEAKGWYSADSFRIVNQVSVQREALVYEILRTLGVTTLSSRLVDLSYTDAGGLGTLTRKAMLLEDDEEFSRRQEATQITYTEDSVDGPLDPSLPVFKNGVAEKFAPEQVAEAVLGQAVAGNHDSILRVSMDDHSSDGGGALYNYFVIQDSSGNRRPIPYDFDVANAVNGRNGMDPVEVDLTDYKVFPGLDAEFLFAFDRIQALRAFLPKDVMKNIRTRFLAAKPGVLAVLKKALVDEPGRKLIQSHVDFFFSALGPAYEHPVILKPTGVTAYHDAAKKNLCGQLAKGTLVTKVAENAGMIQVRTYNPLRDGEDGACEEKGPFWISKQAPIGTAYP